MQIILFPVAVLFSFLLFLVLVLSFDKYVSFEKDVFSFAYLFFGLSSALEGKVTDKFLFDFLAATTFSWASVARCTGVSVRIPVVFVLLALHFQGPDLGYGCIISGVVLILSFMADDEILLLQSAKE